jgi:hypothetical protein
MLSKIPDIQISLVRYLPASEGDCVLGKGNLCWNHTSSEGFAPRSLQDPPKVDPFADVPNNLCGEFWTRRFNAVLQDWAGGAPVWANPPFSILTRVLTKLQEDGGHVLLL